LSKEKRRGRQKEVSREKIKLETQQLRRLRERKDDLL